MTSKCQYLSVWEMLEIFSHGVRTPQWKEQERRRLLELKCSRLLYVSVSLPAVYIPTKVHNGFPIVYSTDYNNNEYKSCYLIIVAITCELVTTARQFR